MKTKLFTAAAMLFILAIYVNAQTPEELRVKVLPGAPGILKVLYAHETRERLEIKFVNASGVIATDIVKAEYPDGLLKRYDIRRISKNHFWVEIASPQMSVTYRVEPSKDGKTFTSHLEKSTFNHPLVKRNN